MSTLDLDAIEWRHREAVGTWMPAFVDVGGAMSSLADIPGLVARVRELEALLSESRRRHFTCGLCTDECKAFDGGPCECGASEWNAQIDAALTGGDS